MTPNQSSARKAALIPALAILFLALLPQIFLLIGGRWNGSYFVSNYDEPAYSAYVNALINGKPRKNDPFLGLADSSETPQPETLYSIQFIPPYAIALPARILGINVSTAFIVLAAFMAIFSVLSIYKFLLDTTDDPLIAAVGPVVILCLGTAVAFQGELRNLIEGRVLADFFPFLRRYQPGVAFPLFFVFCLFVWNAVRSNSIARLAAYAAAAGGVFAVLVYSYFYLWTAAAAWLFCFTAVSLILNKKDLKKSMAVAAIIAAVGGVALVPYFYLLSLRSNNLDSVQLLSFTRTPELASPSMLIGLIVTGIAIFVLRSQRNETSKRLLSLILAFALTPVILFNQQIITGQSLQPVHYELFIANYLVLTAAMLLLGAWRMSEDTEVSSLPGYRRSLLYLGIAAFTWGLFEAYGSTSRNLTAAEIRDASIPALSAAVTEGRISTVLATNFVTADFIPSIRVARSLWNPHSSSAGGIDIEENKRLFHMYLYFSGYTESNLEEALKANSFEVTAAIFGSERALPSLAGNSKKISTEEIRAEAVKYAEFSKNIDGRTAYRPTIDHIIVPAEAEPSFTNLDSWYTRDEGKPFGLFKLYNLKPKAAGR